MKNLLVLFIGFLLFSSTYVSAQPPKIVSECTIVYNMSVEDSKSSPELIKSLNGATKTVYIKGSKSRTELVSPSYTLTIINDTKTDTTVVLRELGNTKYMSFLDQAKKLEKNRKFEGIDFIATTETKTILGYDCKKVVAKLKDGSTYNVYYAPSIVPSNREYEYQLKGLAGLALEYETESEDGKVKFTFTAVKITLTPVQAAKFDLPKSGYRIL
jgi:GLPGLI family protein